MNYPQAGIDAISFYTPAFYLDLAEKVQQTAGQCKMAVCPPDEDIVTMAANAASKILQDIDINKIEMLLFATETGIDQSKSAGIYVHNLLGLPKNCRVVELKQACYSATATLQLARAWLQQNPQKKILLIGSDIAKYELNSAAEKSQGAGAIAILLSANPKILAIEAECGVFVEDVMDFWRPNYRKDALVDGKLSLEYYIKILIETWRQYTKRSERKFYDHQRFCYHTPVPRLVENAHKKLARFTNKELLTVDQVNVHVGDGLNYTRQIGNCYTASMYISLTSLLENTESDLTEQRIGFYSYGSGCTGEFFSGVVQIGYKQFLNKHYHQQMLNHRKAISHDQYVDFHEFDYPTSERALTLDYFTTGQFRLARIANHQRFYERNELKKEVGDGRRTRNSNRFS